MENLGRRGWLTRPKAGKVLPGTPFFHVLSKKTPSPLQLQLSREAHLREDELQGEGEAARTEFQQWKWILDWDGAKSWTKQGKGSLDRALRDYPKALPAPPAGHSSPLAFLLSGDEIPPGRAGWLALYSPQNNGGGRRAKGPRAGEAPVMEVQAKQLTSSSKTE
jgi:hypothetical protein